MTTARDAAAYKLIYDTRATRLVRARERAEKWIAGLSALVTVLTTAMVVKGPENFAKADGHVRGVVLVLVIAGAFGVGTGLMFAYSAAFGGLWKTSKVDALVGKPPTVAANAGALLEVAASADAEAAQRSMRIAAGGTMFAMICLTAAVAVAWFATPKLSPNSKSCVETPTGVLELSTPAIVKSGSVALVPCR